MRERFTFSAFFYECRQHRVILQKYTAFFLTGALIIGCLSFLSGMGRSVSYGAVSSLQSGCFAGLGLVYLYFFKKLSFWRDSLLITAGGWWYTLLLSLGMGAGLTILFAATGKGYPGITWAGICIFVFPVMIIQSWRAFAVIPERKYPVWYPPFAVADPLIIPKKRSIAVQIRVSRDYFDGQEISFTANMPERVRLGRLVYHFINEQNENNAAGISLLDEAQRPFGWEFYKRAWGGMIKKRLYPEENMTENGIKDKDTVFVKRVKMEKS